jgi:excisionase family DNA binding protein
MRTYHSFDTAFIVVQTQSIKLISVRDQAQQLGISARHLHDLTKQRLIPCVRLGRAVRYNPAAVAQAIEKNLTQRSLA